MNQAPNTTDTRVDEIADGIYRISTPSTVVPGGFTFNQFLIRDDEPSPLPHGPSRALCRRSRRRSAG
jgi:hypothetical protein